MSDNSDGNKAAELIVDEIIMDIEDRRGLGDAFEDCDPDIQKEMRDSWKAIVRKHLSS